MITLTLDGRDLLYRTPYNPGLVADLKTQISATERQWDGAAKAWRVAAQHGAVLATLTRQYFGEVISVPQPPPVLSMKGQRLLDVRYIGTTKERGGSERTAFGWCNGAWAVVFSESSLRAWFDAPAWPGEESTLYQTLAVKATSTADELKSAYRRLARQWHPDVCREPEATEVFKAIQHAWEVLSNPAQRARYDAGLRLAATVGRADMAGMVTANGYRSPLRCGLILAEGADVLGRFVVASIQAWEDIVDPLGRVLTTSWPAGADTFREQWV